MRPAGAGAAARAMPPGGWLALALFYGLAVVALVTALAASQPRLGLQLRWSDAAGGAQVLQASGPAAAIAAGTVLTGVQGEGGRMAFTAHDFVQEPAAGLKTFREYDEMLARQDRLAALQAGPGLGFIDSQGQVHPVQPEPVRHLLLLPVEFWVQVAVGFFAWLISAGVWIFRRREASARYLLLSGWSTLLFAPFAAVYSTRELALPAQQFRWLCDLNFYGGCIYVATMVALLWYYPRRLGRLALGPLLLGLYTLWWLAQELRLVDSMLMGRRSLVFAGFAATLALAVVQWRATRRDPVARAALQWFLLSWLLGSGIFAALNFVPQIFGISMAALQGYSFLLFLLVYGGLAFGILRFRLFELGEWWFRILLWVAGAFLFFALDLFLLLMLHLSPTVSLSLALLICGFVWLPLRGWLWGRLVERSRPPQQELFRRVLDISLAASAQERLARWRGLLRSMFDPLQMDEQAAPAARAVIVDDGLALVLPAAGPGPGLVLRYPGGGGRLFAPRDLALAEEVLDMLRYADGSRDAYNQGAQEERARIARDLHDDLGSRLLSSLHQTGVEQTRQVIQQAINEMCTIVNGLTGTRMPLASVIAELRHETSRRLEAAGLALEWPLHDDNDGVVLGYGSYRNYMAILRELVSNVLRHAGARCVFVDIRCEGGELLTTVRDDGGGLDGARGTGHGLANLRSRAAELGGHIRFDSGPQGTLARVVLPLPLPRIGAAR
ncbi:sensor histidine kinase [Variovorax terrae]|uniref:histidine kinase n=1 Tax=Variovorax terrae TaxID=2923278 RepID=A0A9X1W0T7_9BURK|nr:ATP-binding protein [Variovorax terrae]MCJ0765602.1 hypothetical protein [Variovorax terrae]